MSFATSNVGVRTVLAVGFIAILVVFVVDMSGSAPRTSGSDHVSSPVFAATVPPAGVLCQAVAAPPPDTGSVSMLVGTYGHPVPPLTLTLAKPGGPTVATGSLPGGGREGWVRVPLAFSGRASGVLDACLRVGGSYRVVIAGQAGPKGSERVNGRRQPGDISLIYFRRGSESWWQLLPTLVTRFGLGKASFFGDWTLPAMALALIVTWIAVVRLLVREPR